MRAGLYPLTVIAEFLGQRPAAMEDRIRLDGLPVIEVPAATRPVRKVALAALHGWLAARSSGRALTLDELAQELDRCAEAVRQRHQAKAEKAKKKAA